MRAAHQFRVYLPRALAYRLTEPVRSSCSRLLVRRLAEDVKIIAIYSSPLSRKTVAKKRSPKAQDDYVDDGDDHRKAIPAQRIRFMEKRHRIRMTDDSER